MKRFTVHVEGFDYPESATYRIAAKSEKEAKKKAEKKFNEETAYSYECVEANIKTKGRRIV